MAIFGKLGSGGPAPGRGSVVSGKTGVGGRAFALLICCFASPAWAQVTVPEENAKTIQHRSEIGTLGDNLAGDQIDLSTGRLEIVQTDIDLPGNNALPVRVTRRFQPADSYNSGHFGIWTMDLPNIRGTFARFIGSHWPTDFGAYNRCSNFSQPPFVAYQYATWDPSEYWNGTTLHLPGGGGGELLVNGGHAPTDGATYTVGTLNGEAARCVPLASTSVSGALGEGFEVVATDGVVYTINQMVIGNQTSLKKSSYTPAALTASTPTTLASKPITIQQSTQPVLPREDVILFPTKVADRFGNTVTYQWSTTNPWQLLQILASDGRHLDFTYASSTGKQVTAVTDGAHTWTYGYGTGGDTLTLPDGGVWTFQLYSLFRMSVKPTGSYCGTVNGVSSRTTYTSGTAGYTGSITAPSGATVTLGLSRVLLGRSYAVYECTTDGTDPSTAYAHNPYLFLTAAVVSKTITGVGLPAGGLTWSYSYGPTNNCWGGPSGVQGVLCTATSPTVRLVNVTDPHGDTTRYTFGNKYNDNEGLLLTTESGWNGSSALRTTSIDYALPYAAPYASFQGGSIRTSGDVDMTGYPHPRRKVVTTQQGRTFTWEVASDCAGVPYCFDSFTRPTKLIKTSTP